VDVVDTAFTPALRVRGRVTRVVRKVVGTGATEGTATITNNADPNINYAQRNALIRQAKDLHHFEGTTKKVIDSYKTQGYASRDSIRAGEWKAEIFRDADDADKDPTHYVHEFKRVKAGEKLTFRVAPGGGFVVRFDRSPCASAKLPPFVSLSRRRNLR
jgi:hypothetical protein